MNFLADIPREVFRQMRADGTLSNYECKHCVGVDDAEQAIRRDFVHGFSITSQNR